MMGMMPWKTLGVREVTRDAVNELVGKIDDEDVSSADEYIRDTLEGETARTLLSDDIIEKLEAVEGDDA